VLETLLRRGVGPPGMYLLITRGRRSGQPRSTPVTLIGDHLVAPYGPVAWVHNARAAGSVELRRGRNARTATITELPPAEAAPVLQAYVRKIAVVRPYFDARKDDPVAAFEREAARHPVFRLG
jgi:deazaflavin-dependent oxidoreductase (nitroreductase family)